MCPVEADGYKNKSNKEEDYRENRSERIKKKGHAKKNKDTPRKNKKRE